MVTVHGEAVMNIAGLRTGWREAPAPLTPFPGGQMPRATGEQAG